MIKEKFDPVEAVAGFVRNEDGTGSFEVHPGAIIQLIMQMDPDEIRETVGEHAVRRAAAFFTGVGKALQSSVDEAERQRAEAKLKEDA